MYEPPKSDLEKYEAKGNYCPKCGTPISMWDYIKPRAGSANTMDCKGCGSKLRYNLSKLETYLFGLSGLILSFIPAYFLWPSEEFFKFAVIYVPTLFVIISVVGVLEAIYVRKHRKVEVKSEIK